jgi:predicted MFS family arabinose efflux permease
MTFWVAFTEQLPTLLLVSMGASELQLGLQRSFLPALKPLQLNVLRMISRVPKRNILLAGQLFALLAALPLLLPGTLASLGDAPARVAVLTSLALVAVGINVADTTWFPLLRSYVDPARISRFFGLLRTSWGIALIAFFTICQLWLSRNLDSFAPLFAGAWLLGGIRCLMVMRMPERSERTGDAIRVREAFALLYADRDLQRYLVGTAANGALRTAAIPFAIVMMRREVGFSQADIVLATVVYYAGGVASLYAWGRVADRFGPAPVFGVCAAGLAASLALLVGVESTEAGQLAIVLAFFFGHAVFSAGFGVADTQVLFRLAPPAAPTRMLVIAGVTGSAAMALAPIVAGAALEGSLAGSVDRISVYHGFFLAVALLQLLVFPPLIGFTRTRLHEISSARSELAGE